MKPEILYVAMRVNAKWHSRQFNVPDQTMRLRAYGQTEAQADERMRQILDARLPGGYVLTCIGSTDLGRD